VAAGRGSGSAAQSTAAAARQPERAGQFVNGIYAGPGSRQTPAGAKPDPAQPDQATDSGSSTSIQTGKQSDSWWYTGAQEMEAARLATAAAVRRGEAEPFPLTPLTPVGTPAELISAEQRYFNHFVPQF